MYLLSKVLSVGCLRSKASASFRFLWPWIVNKLWSERENQQDAPVRCLLSIIYQHDSGIIMPIFRRTKTVCYCKWCAALFLLDVVGSGCGSLRCRERALWKETNSNLHSARTLQRSAPQPSKSVICTEVTSSRFNGLLQHQIHKGKAVPLQAWTGPEGSRKLNFTDFVTTAQDGGRLPALSTDRVYPQEIVLVIISVRGWFDPRTIVRLEGLCQWKTNWHQLGSKHRPSNL